MILRRLCVCCSPDGKGPMTNPTGLFRSGPSTRLAVANVPRLRVKREMFSTHRPSLNFTMVTTRSSACTLWVGRTRLERWWTTQVSLCFSSWTDSTYRWASAPKPHPWLHRPASLMVPSCCFSQTPKTKATVFKLCSLCLYLPQDQLTCWGVGGIEDHLRPYMPDWGFLLNSATWGKASPLPPAETFRSKVMSSSPPISLHKDLNLCLDITCFCSPLPALRLIQFHPCVLPPPPPPPPPAPSVPPLCHFWIGSLVSYFSTPFHSLSVTHPVLFLWTCTNIDIFIFLIFFCVVGSLGAALSTTPVIQGTLYVASNQKQTSHRSSRWFSDGHVYPCFHKERIVEDCKVSGFLEQLNTIFWPRDRCE